MIIIIYSEQTTSPSRYVYLEQNSGECFTIALKKTIINNYLNTCTSFNLKQIEQSMRKRLLGEKKFSVNKFQLFSFFFNYFTNKRCQIISFTIRFSFKYLLVTCRHHFFRFTNFYISQFRIG